MTHLGLSGYFGPIHVHPPPIGVCLPCDIIASEADEVLSGDDDEFDLFARTNSDTSSMDRLEEDSVFPLGHGT